MRPIPPTIREELAGDPAMAVCIYDNEDCDGRVEWEHAMIFAGKQVNEVWAIIGCCTWHHRGKGLDKRFNRYCAYRKLFSSDERYIGVMRLKYAPAFDRWEQEYSYLSSIYGKPAA